ncbi:SH2 domain-containing protein 5-like [Acipenser oxyrinchus oxyrinchus]|uniref:SH2 domain-containing protein 5-like n=1 Tax=Acipenser oxyrinchus oxyrinchus TaxID=40147 RepID=A0AAD8CEU7_ACIOX|nr:SH2 domain-containing protein 5-like [Acipenser oxyrinchus oxyrinchus]
MSETSARKTRTETKFAEYVGSCVVEECCLDEKTWLVYELLRSLKDCSRRRAVTLKFSTKGVKVYDADGATLLMAHSMRRILFSTCRPSDSQFAFVAHNPGCSPDELYCHLFVGSQPCEARVLNLLLCRAFQLAYLEKHPEQAESEETASGLEDLPEGNPPLPSLIADGVSLSVSALVSFRRAPFQGELIPDKMADKKLSVPAVSPACSPTLVRKKAIRNKVLRSGAYRSFTCDSQTHRSIQEKLNRGWRSLDFQVGKSFSLSETQDILTEAVWSFAGIHRDSSCSLLHKDILGAFLLWQNPNSSKSWSLSVRTPFGLQGYQIDRNPNGNYILKHHQNEFNSIEALIDHFTEVKGELLCSLNSARLNHCYEGEDFVRGPGSSLHQATGKRAVDSEHAEEPLSLRQH